MGVKQDNMIWELSDVSTSESLLESWISNASGAILCMANAAAWDTAWGVLPKNNQHWAIGFEMPYPGKIRICASVNEPNMQQMMYLINEQSK